MSRKTLLVSLALLLVIAAGAVSGGWLWAAQSFESGWRTWVEARRAEGYRFSDSEPQVGGFPLRVTAHLAEPAVIAPQGWRWQGPPVAASARAWDPFGVRFRTPGRHVVELDGRAPLTVDAARARGRVDLAPSGPERVSADLGRVRLEGLPVGPAAMDSARLELGPRRTAAAGRQAVDVAIAARGVTLPDGVKTPLGRGLDRLDVEATVEGRIPGAPPAEALDGWRRNGGVVKVHRLQVTWGPLRLDGGGNLALDEQMRPLGSLKAEVRGLSATLDRLVQAGMVEPGPAQLAKIAVAALGRRDQDSGDTVIEVPITLRDGRLYLGPAALLRLSPVL